MNKTDVHSFCTKKLYFVSSDIFIPVEFLVLLSYEFEAKGDIYSIEEKLKDYGYCWEFRTDEDSNIIGIGPKAVPKWNKNRTFFDFLPGGRDYYSFDKKQYNMFCKLAKYIKNEGNIMVGTLSRTEHVNFMISFNDGQIIIKQAIDCHWKEIDMPEFIHLSD